MQSAVQAGAFAIALATHASPMPTDRALTELRVLQPVAMIAAALGPLRIHGMLDLEGWTMPGGHLSPGAWGEGFNDRRHPHTFAHELVAALTLPLGRGARASLAAGKGFAPFGTDDPMSRPAVLFPVNHHWSQVLERAVLIGAAELGPVTVEAGWFNGDEPERPQSMPTLRGRFGDSWALRAHVRPRRGVELQLSRASVLSPEHRAPAAGPRHEKWSASARYERATPGRRLTALVEWARNSELEGFFVYHSALAEGELVSGRHRPYARIERTERPEEQRLLDPFRSLRPHFENSNLGTTRWLVFTAGYGVRASPASLPLRLELIAEAAWAHVTSITPGGVFRPEQFFGGNDVVSINVGLRMAAGAPMHRMGRYGALAAADAAAGSTSTHRHE